MEITSTKPSVLPANLIPLIEAWQTPQTGLASVARWAKYRKGEPGVRHQDSLQHSFSIVLLGMMVLAQLRKHGNNLTEELILKALAVHDIGEGEIQRDTHYIDKNPDGDIAEYLAFRERYVKLDPVVFNELHRAFLLQFASKTPWDGFPPDARVILNNIRQYFHMEILTFEAIERWDYVLYAFEQYHERQNAKILVQVLRNQMRHLDLLAQLIPGFREADWTYELEQWCMAFVDQHIGLWIEQKGEV
jgi:hypothetical protein